MFKLQDLMTDPAFVTLDQKLNDFNIFDVLQISSYEIRHTTYLAHLLDPHGSHGFGSTFLRNFLLHASKQVSALERSGWLDDLQSLDLEQSKVSAELSLRPQNATLADDLGIEKTKSQPEKNREGQLDILLQVPHRDDARNDVAIAIENKIFSRQGVRQLEKYEAWVTKRFEKHVLLYLTVMEEECADTWTGISYSNTVYPALEMTLQKFATIKSPATIMLEHYMTALSNLVEAEAALAGTDLIAQEIHDSYPEANRMIEELRKVNHATIDGKALPRNWGLYRRHKVTFDFLVRFYRDDLSKMLNWFTTEWPLELAKKGPLRLIIDDSNRTMIRFLPVTAQSPLAGFSRQYAQQINEHGKRPWTSKQNAVLFELRYDARQNIAEDGEACNVHTGWNLYLVVGPLQDIERVPFVEQLRTMLDSSVREQLPQLDIAIRAAQVSEKFTTVMKLRLPDSATVEMTMVSDEMLQFLELVSEVLTSAFEVHDKSTRRGQD